MGVNALIEDIDRMMIATESLSDVGVFMENPTYYLETSTKRYPGASFVEELNTDGSLYLSVDNICSELLRVQAFQEAISIYERMIEICKELTGEVTSKKEKNVLIQTMDDFQCSIVDIMRQRNEYTSKRKAVLGKYSDIIKRVK